MIAPQEAASQRERHDQEADDGANAIPAAIARSPLARPTATTTAIAIRATASAMIRAE